MLNVNGEEATTSCVLWQWCPEGAQDCNPSTCWLGAAVSSSSDDDGGSSAYDCSQNGPEWVGGGRDNDGGGGDVEIVVGVYDGTSDTQATGKQRVAAFSAPGQSDTKIW